MGDETTKVYIQSPKWFIRPRNTDWRYARYMIPRISEFVQGCRFYPANSNSATIQANLHYARLSLCHRLKISSGNDGGSYLDKKDLSQSGCDVVFCHEGFPKNADSVPVIWQNSILDPRMTLAYGASEQSLAKEREAKARGFEKAVAVQVSTEAERARLGQSFPHIADKFVAIPFFLPDVVGISRDSLDKKIERGGPLRCLFVGHEAKRKGLARVYSALERLPPGLQRQTHLTVISRQSDGRISAPSLPNLKVIDEAPHEQVLQLMRDSDVLVVPSLFESYGLAFIEAMAQGTIPVVPDWEVQREIVDYGKAGVVTSGDPAHLSSILECLSTDGGLRRSLAIHARQRFEQNFAPSIVAKQYALMFSQSAHMTQMGALHAHGVVGREHDSK